MASLNTSLDCQPADLSIGSTGKEDFFSYIHSDIVNTVRCFFDPCIRDPGWVKNQDPDPVKPTRGELRKCK
jgi:hypothetical protein